MDIKIKRVNTVTLLLSLAWIIAVFSSMLYTVSNIEEKYYRVALEHAKNAFHKDLVFRKWVASHGGVYVFTTEKTPPNPYLSHIPNRDLTTITGEKLTLMNPAYTLRELMNNYSGLYGQKGHITSLYLLNPNNKPDKWETKVLKIFEKKESMDFHEIYNYKGKEHLRYMKALITKQSCLKCHAAQGYKVGDIRGGISITIPLEKYNSDESVEKKRAVYLHLFLLVLVLLVGFYSCKRIKKTLKKEMEMDRELQEKERILFEQSKMASLGEMLANIAHQWRQPLSVISTSASSVKLFNELGNLDDNLINESMDSIENGTQYLSQTIDDFRDFIKGDKRKKLYDIAENIHRDLKIMTGSIKDNQINIILDIKNDLKVNGFPNELTQAVINIINNSKDALIENKIKKRYIFISAVQENDNIVLKIKDNANGIPEEIIENIFEPYFTTKHKSQGTGLGLYMTHKIICESMGGKIEARNVEYVHEENKYSGAEFTIKIPR